MEHAPAADASFVLDKECDETEETEEDMKTEGAETKSARFCGAKPKSHRHTIVLAFCIFAVGTICAVAFLAVGIPGLKVEQAVLFEKQTNEIVQAVQSTWEDYELVALWIHQSMRTKQNYSSFWHERQEFAVLSRYVQAHGVNPLALGYVPNVTHAERLALEEESRDYYSQVAPELPYLGFTEWQANRSSAPGYSVVKAPVRDVYFPQVLIEPLEGNEAYVDVDMSGSGQGALLRQALAEQKVVVSPPFSRGRPDSRGKAVYLLHPGIPMDEATLPVVTMGANSNNETATAAPSAIPNRGLASVLIAFGPFMERVALGQVEDVSVYIYALDTSWGAYLFGGAKWTANCTETKLIPDPPSWEELSTSIAPDCMLYRDLEIAQQKWRVVVVDDTRLYKANLTVTTLGGILMFVASLVLVTWFVSRTLRNQALVCLQEATRAEKAALILHNAQTTVAAERQRNEYLAHEVRNPLAAALSACSFLETAHTGLFPRQQDHADNNTLGRNTLAEQSSSSPITVVQAKEDLTVIKSSLTYINDLLRSMLDVNKIASRQLALQPTPTDLYRDIIEPIRTILHRRDNPFAVEVECPTDLIVSVDRMRLKQ
jgi:signal transduction histidine kinase